MDYIILRNTTTEDQIIMDYDRYGFIISKIDISGVTAEHKIYAGLHQIGQQVIDSTLTYRDITLSGWIKGYSKEDLLHKKHKLSCICSPLQSVDLITYDNLKLTITPAYSVQYNNSNNGIYAQWNLSAIAYDPCFTTIDYIIATYSQYAKNLHYPNSYRAEGMAYTIASKSNAMRVINEGDLPCGFIAEAQTEFAINTFSLQCTNISAGTDTSIIINYEFLAGDKIIIDTRYGKKSIKLTRNKSIIDITGSIDYSSDFPQLGQGSNIINYNVGIDNHDGIYLIIKYLPLYLGG